ncbi:MAG: hypothetical protein M1339_06560, partial [Bacteroidetes bacterium]|nr:hypothetical protein [Bacteroidota bacterium]
MSRDTASVVEDSKSTKLLSTRELSVGHNGDNADKIYFPELDGLRFLAFMMVFVFHFVVFTQILTQS